MYMKGLRKISLHLVMLMLIGIAFTFAGCKNPTDTVLTQQQQSIEKYLQNSHNPRLIDEAEIVNSLEENPAFYTRWEMDIYRYIATYYDEGRSQKPEISRGTTFEIIYTAYIFSGNNPAVSNMYATNDAAMLSELEALGLNITYEWSTEPMRVTLGTDDLVSGLNTALEGCHEGDIVEIYLTFPEAYGNSYLGKVPSKSSVAWFIEITNIIE